MAKNHVTRLNHSSEFDDWETDPDWFRRWNQVYNFNLDVCCWPETAKCEKYFTPKENGLRQTWEGRVWCNPPYSDDTVWFSQAYLQRNNYEYAMFLVIAKTCSEWWSSYAMRSTAIITLRGRAPFKRNGVKGEGTPWHTVLIVFDKKNKQKRPILLNTPAWEPIFYQNYL